MKDRRGERNQKGKGRFDPWYPVPEIGAVLELTRPIHAYWGTLGPHTLVRVVKHTPGYPGRYGYGPGIEVEPVDRYHPIFRKGDDVAIYMCNLEIKTHTRVP